MRQIQNLADHDLRETVCVETANCIPRKSLCSGPATTRLGLEYRYVSLNRKNRAGQKRVLAVALLSVMMSGYPLASPQNVYREGDRAAR
jgi:hypothetical protein